MQLVDYCFSIHLCPGTNATAANVDSIEPVSPFLRCLLFSIAVTIPQLIVFEREAQFSGGIWPTLSLPHVIICPSSTDISGIIGATSLSVY